MASSQKKTKKLQKERAFWLKKLQALSAAEAVLIEALQKKTSSLLR